MTPSKKDNASSNVLIKNENSIISMISKLKPIDEVVAKFFIKNLPTISG